jgi:putative transposase
MAVEVHGASKTFACRELGISRNSLTPPTVRKSTDPVLRRWLRLFAREHPRWGWRKAFWRLRHKGLVVNHKKVRRLWREEGLCRKRKSRKQRCNKPQVNVVAQFPDHVWALDFQFDQTTDGRNLKFLNIIDEFTRESLVSIAARSMTNEDVRNVLADLIRARGAAPLFLRSDNGAEFAASDLVEWLKSNDVTNAFIAPASPWQNGKAESYNGIFRDELLNMELFESVEHAQHLTNTWKHIYNHHRPHGSLRGATPAAFAAEHISPPCL